VKKATATTKKKIRKARTTAEKTAREMAKKAEPGIKKAREAAKKAAERARPVMEEAAEKAEAKMKEAAQKAAPAIKHAAEKAEAKMKEAAQKAAPMLKKAADQALATVKKYAPAVRPPSEVATKPDQVPEPRKPVPVPDQAYTNVLAVAISPHRIFTCWSLPEKLSPQDAVTIRVSDVTGAEEGGGSVVRVVEMPAYESSGGVFIDVYPSSVFQVEVTFSGPSGEGMAHLRSNRVTTPSAQAGEPGAGGAKMPEEHYRAPSAEGEAEEYGYEQD
jgi:hypothetical protein